MKIFLLAVLLLAPITAKAATPTIPTAAFETALNKYPSPANFLKYSLGSVLRQAHNVLICTYSFATQGGAISTINLKQLDAVSNCSLPDNAILWDGVMDWVTPGTSGGSATVSLGANTTTDVVGATAVASLTGLVAITPVGTAASAVKLTAARNITASIATATLTAGKLRLFLHYSLSE